MKNTVTKFVKIMMQQDNFIKKQLHEIAFLLERLGEALFYKTELETDEFKGMVYFAAVRRFDLLAQSFLIILVKDWVWSGKIVEEI